MFALANHPDKTGDASMFVCVKEGELILTFIATCYTQRRPDSCLVDILQKYIQRSTTQ
jgi:hypothetical protein